MASADELDFLVETARLERGLLEAKDARAATAEGSPERAEADAAYRAAKNATREWRQFWRQVREAIGAQPADGDAIAAPATHGMGVGAGAVEVDQ